MLQLKVACGHACCNRQQKKIANAKRRRNAKRLQQWRLQQYASPTPPVGAARTRVPQAAVGAPQAGVGAPHTGVGAPHAGVGAPPAPQAAVEVPHAVAAGDSPLDAPRSNVAVKMDCT